MIGHRQLGTIASVPRILPHEFFEQVARSIQVGGPCARYSSLVRDPPIQARPKMSGLDSSVPGPSGTRRRLGPLS